MQRQLSFKTGFTLIELSIVLVIIGLIVGGVLVGQDLVKAAAVRAQVSQLESYNSAVNTFRDKYGGIPGDLSVSLATQFGFDVPSDCTGQQGGRDGNGLIDGNVFPTIYSSLLGENILFWSDLGSARLAAISEPRGSTPGVTPSCTAASYISTTKAASYLPAGKIGYGSYVHVYEANGSNWYMVATINSTDGAHAFVNASAAIPVGLSYNIDRKMDDGLPTTGNVQAVYLTTSQANLVLAPNAASDTPATCYNTTGPAYSIAVNAGAGANCALSFRFQ